MKRRIIIGVFAAVLFIGAGAVLIQNKNAMESRIIKDDVTEYPVTVEEVKSTQVNRKVKFVGTTEAFNDIELLSETQGRVLDVRIENGGSVAKGSAIAFVDDELLKANFTLAESGYEKAKRDNDRYETLFKAGNISLSDAENSRISLKNAEAQFIIARKYLANSKIASPINGIVARRYINTGSTVAPGSPVANIVDISKLKIKICLPENDIKRINKNMEAAISSSLYPDKKFYGKVVSIGIKADDAHNYPVEILLNNNENKFSAGMYVEASFNYESRENLPVIPRNALLGSVKNPQIYTAVNGKALLKNIIISEIDGDAVLVKSGINSGDKIIIGGRNNIEDGSPIIITNK